MKNIKSIWINWLCWNILALFLALLASIFIVQTDGKPKTNPYYIDPPKTVSAKSKNENKNIHSFLASPFEQYTIYTAPKKPTSYADFASASFSGNLDNYENIVNDSYEVSLWNNDIDIFQYVVKLKENLTSLTVAIENEAELNQQGLTFSYGLNDYIFSTDVSYPNFGIWTPDKITDKKELPEDYLVKERIYSFFFRVISDKVQLTSPEIILKTATKNAAAETYEQKNTIKVNYVNKTYQPEINKYNEVNFLNNDQRLTHYYLRKDRESFAPDFDWNDEVKYVDYIWNNYLTEFYKRMVKDYLDPYYITFMTNITGKWKGTDHKDLTWDYDSNDPTLLTWHAKKSEDSDKYTIYLPEDEMTAFKNNLDYAIKAGFNKVFLRGLDGAKISENPLGSERMKIGHHNKFINDETGEPIYIANSPFNDDLVPEINLTGKEITKTMIQLTMDMINSMPANDNVTYYWYYDESPQSDYAANIDILNDLKKASPDQYGKYKTAYAVLYKDIEVDNQIVLDTDLLYLHHFDFRDLSTSKLYQNFIKYREAKGFGTSQYTMDSSKNQILGLEPGANAFWVNWMSFNSMPGFMHYAMNSWTEDSAWTSDYFQDVVETGEIVYIYPNDEDHSKTWFSLRFEMLNFGYRLSVKQKVISQEDPNFWSRYYDHFYNVSQTAGQMSASKFDFGIINENDYYSSKNSSWLLLNWLLSLKRNTLDINVKLKSNYWMVNHL